MIMMGLSSWVKIIACYCFRQGKLVDKEKITSVGIPKYMKKQEKPTEETQDIQEVNF